jgi:crotonobetainyl-CoA:carnitine CoA-transferase CaiB-like acyl-CoA transferase
VPVRTGSQRPDGGPAGIFRHSDEQFITLMVLPHQWPQLIRALKMPELEKDPRFSTGRLRRENNEALRVLIEDWLARFPTRQEALNALEAERVPCAPVLTLKEVVAHPHLRSRETVRTVTDPLLGDFFIPGFPVKFSGWSPERNLKADLLGESNEHVLSELAGLSREEIAKLYDHNVLVRDPALNCLSETNAVSAKVVSR